MARLEQGPMTVRDLSRVIRVSEKEIIAHMEHVARSLQPPKHLEMEPPECHRCGFVFSQRRRFSIPGRCPQCRHEGIRPAVFVIRGVAGGD